jgi:hypothetical protein
MEYCFRNHRPGFVVVAAQFMRTLLPTHEKIIFEELPNAERLWQLVENINLVRQRKMWLIQQRLFSELILLYRSPDMLLSFTKSKDD